MPRNPRIGCLCVTDDRAPVFGIALASFLTQDYDNAELLVLTPSPLPPYCDVIDRVMGTKRGYNEAFDKCLAAYVQWDHKGRAVRICRTGSPHVTENLDYGCKLMFEDSGMKDADGKPLFREHCDIVTMWDDDDWSPPGRLFSTAQCSATNFALACGYTMPTQQEVDSYRLLAGYNGGWFCNLKTLQGHEVLLNPETNPIWGGSLAFSKTTWRWLGGFRDRPFPGYDRSFVNDFKAKGVWIHAISPDCRNGPIGRGPIAFAHGKNVATWPKEPCVDMTEALSKELPHLVALEVSLASEFLKERRVHVPGGA